MTQGGVRDSPLIWIKIGRGVLFKLLKLLTKMPLGLTYWTNNVSSENPTHSYPYYAGIYALFKFLATVSLLLLGISIFIISIRRTGANVHQYALRTLIRTPLSFFTTRHRRCYKSLLSRPKPHRHWATECIVEHPLLRKCPSLPYSIPNLPEPMCKGICRARLS